MGFKNYKQGKDDEVTLLAEGSIKIEEAFNEKDLIRVGELLSKMAAKRLGGKFDYLYTERFKKMNGQKGQGALFASANGQLLRYNYMSTARGAYTVNSIDYWKNKKIGEKPTLSVSFDNEINVVDIAKTLFDRLKEGKATKFKKHKLTEGLSTDQKLEIRRDFVSKYNLAPSYANSPGALRKKVYELGGGEEYDNALQVISVAPAPDEVTSTQKTWKEDQKQLSSPTGTFADPDFVFKDMEEAALVVAKKKWRSLIIAGMGGIGKTYGVKQVLTKELGPYGEGPDGKWAFYEGLKVSGFGLFKLLLLNKDKLVVFDDSDSIWGDKDIINMMKIVTSDSGERTISWTSNSTAPVGLMSKSEREEYEMSYLADLMEDPNTKMKAPSTFNFSGQMINISNMAAEKFDDAIKSRAIFINVFLAQRDVIRRMYTIKQMQGVSSEKIEYLLKLIDPDAMDAIAGIGKYGGEVKYVTAEDARKNKTMNMRTLDIAEALMDAGVANLQHMVSMYA